MKIHIQKQPKEQGSALLVTLTIGVILLFTLASYISLLSAQKGLVTRSQSWNAAMTMSEAGLEEALAQVNSGVNIFNFGLQSSSSAPTNQDFSNNGWTTSQPSATIGADGPMIRSLSGGTYSVIIQTNGGPTPIIYSTGYATVPIVGSTISRTVKITTSTEALINVGIGAIGNINFNGNGIATDSWDSTKTNLSTNGQYDPNKTSTNGSIASVGGLIDLGNHTVDGNEYLGPTATNNNNGTVTGTTYYDYNVQFPDVVLPGGASGWPTATTTTVKVGNKNVTEYDFTTSGDYILTSGTLPIVVEPGVVVNLNVTSTSFNPSGISLPGGVGAAGTARFYFNGPTSITVSGNNTVPDNTTPENLWFFGLPSLTSITYGGDSSFSGVIYAPEASLTLNGGGNNTGISGAAIVNNITMNGHYNIHYDESLATDGPNRGYVASSWQELYQ